MRGLKRLRSARVISAGHAFVQNLRRGHYELATDIDPRHRIPHAFTNSFSPSELCTAAPYRAHHATTQHCHLEPAV
jgi:hypothetical protein